MTGIATAYMDSIPLVVSFVIALSVIIGIGFLVGNAGEMPALISQSLGQQDDSDLPPLFQIGPQLGPVDARRPEGGVVFQIPLIPRVEDRSSGSGAQ